MRARGQAQVNTVERTHRQTRHRHRVRCRLSGFFTHSQPHIAECSELILQYFTRIYGGNGPLSLTIVRKNAPKLQQGLETVQLLCF